MRNDGGIAKRVEADRVYNNRLAFQQERFTLENIAEWDERGRQKAAHLVYKRGLEEKMLKQRQRLFSKQQALRELYEREELEFQKRIYEAMPKPEDRRSKLIAQATALKAAREEERKAFADQKMYEAWREQISELRDIDRSMKVVQVMAEWDASISRKADQAKAQKREEAAYRTLAECSFRTALMRDIKEREIARQKADQLKDQLVSQISEAEARKEKENNDLLEERSALLRQWELQDAEANEKENQRKIKFMEIAQEIMEFSLQQKERCAVQANVERLEMQEALEQMKLENLKVEEEAKAQNEKRKNEATRLNLILIESLKKEEENTAYLDKFVKDQNDEIWDKREAEIEKRERARLHLRDMVNMERSEQIKYKNELENQNKLQSKEDLKEINQDLQAYLEECKEKAANTASKIDKYKDTLISQVNENTKAKELEEATKQEEHEVDEKNRQALEDRIAAEIQKQQELLEQVKNRRRKARC